MPVRSWMLINIIHTMNYGHSYKLVCLESMSLFSFAMCLGTNLRLYMFILFLPISPLTVLWPYVALEPPPTLQSPYNYRQGFCPTIKGYIPSESSHETRALFLCPAPFTTESSISHFSSQEYWGQLSYLINKIFTMLRSSIQRNSSKHNMRKFKPSSTLQKQ